MGGRPRAGEEKPAQLIAPVKDERSTAHKAAEVFNTNRTYINEAAKLKRERPDAFKKVKAGEATITQIKREIKEERREARREENRAKVAEVTEPVHLAMTCRARWATLVLLSSNPESIRHCSPPTAT